MSQNSAAQNLWKNIFKNLDAKEVFDFFEIGSKIEFEYITDMLIQDRIDPRLFASNIEVLAKGGVRLSLYDIEFEREPATPTPSLRSYIRFIDRASGLPMWFYAAYPDVAHWFHKWQGEKIDKTVICETSKLFGIKIELENIKDNKITEEQLEKLLMNDKGKIRPKYLKNLVTYYRNKIGKKLEAAVEEGSRDDIYLASSLFKVLGIENNFILIAENTTKYYLELARNYRNRFEDNFSLLAVAGILDAQYYIFIEKTIDLQEIIELARTSVLSAKNEEEVLADFIIKLEIKLFNIDNKRDNTDMSEKEVEYTCKEQKENIIEAVKRTKETYGTEVSFASAVNIFMNDINFLPYRKMLGIKSKDEGKINL